jgi:hypothetical protein
MKITRGGDVCFSARIWRGKGSRLKLGYSTPPRLGAISVLEHAGLNSSMNNRCS